MSQDLSIVKITLAMTGVLGTRKRKSKNEIKKKKKNPKPLDDR